MVEPNELLREGLKRILAGTAYSPTMSVSDLDEVEPMLEAGGRALLLILDAVRDHAATCERVRSLRVQKPSIRIVMLVERYDLEQMLTAIESGAAAYVLKAMSHEALIKFLDLVMLGETVFPIAVFTELGESASVPDACNVSGLTKRERAILECLTDGASNKVIARKLDSAEAQSKFTSKQLCASSR